MLARLFPFKRGLCHAYWAANAWALYNTADKALSLGLMTAFWEWVDRHSTAAGACGAGTGPGRRADGRPGHRRPAHGTSAGSDAPRHAAALRPCNAGMQHVHPSHWPMSLQPALYRLWRHPDFTSLVKAVVGCAGASFMFGWHVHEKAVLLITLPYACALFHVRAGIFIARQADCAGRRGPGRAVLSAERGRQLRAAAAAVPASRSAFTAATANANTPTPAQRRCSN